MFHVHVHTETFTCRCAPLSFFHIAQLRTHKIRKEKREKKKMKWNESQCSLTWIIIKTIHTKCVLYIGERPDTTHTHTQHRSKSTERSKTSARRFELKFVADRIFMEIRQLCEEMYRANGNSSDVYNSDDDDDDAASSSVQIFFKLYSEALLLSSSFHRSLSLSLHFSHRSGCSLPNKF